MNTPMLVEATPWLRGGQHSCPPRAESGGGLLRARTTCPKVTVLPTWPRVSSTRRARSFGWLTCAAVLAASASLRAGDFAEGNAAAWGAFASDYAATSLSNDATQVKAGAYSLRFDTGSGFDTGI